MDDNLKEAMVNDLLDVIDNKLLNEQTIGNFSYWYLQALLEITRELENGREFYTKIKSYIEQINIRRLMKKEKIVVGFIANYSSTWSGDELYKLLEASDRFEPYVFLIANQNIEDIELIKKEYRENLNYFNKKGFRVKSTFDLESGRQYSWDEVGIMPEICIWLTSWVELFKDQYYLLNYPLSVLHTYIPYGFMIAENKNKNFVFQQYDKTIHNIAWKNFWESSFSLELSEKYSFAGKLNGVYTGVPKMDRLYNNETTNESVWDELLRKNNKLNSKKIIFAPHHSICDEGTVMFSTFQYNYRVMIDMAKKYEDETVWVFKPHPQLKYKAVKSGIFKDMDEWDKYINEWKSLKNATVIEEGDYCDLFKDSDAMILDSISFLAEYLYSHKPLLFLRKDGQYFNEFGEKLIEVHYGVNGNEEKLIEEFIMDIVIKENDYMKLERERFFDQYLDYKKYNNKSAAECIFSELLI